MFAHVAERFGADQAAGAVVVQAAAVEVRVEAQLRGVAFPDEVLPVGVEHDDALVARVEGVQVGEGVLFAEVEDGEIVLPLVVVRVAKNPEAQVGVVENEAAKIAVERLKAGAGGDEIVVHREIAQVQFSERLLHAEEIARAVGGARVGAEDGGLADLRVVDVDDRLDADGPLDRLENGLALEEVRREGKILLQGELLAPSEKFRAAELRGADAARCWEAAKLQFGLRNGGEVQKNVLPDDRRVALQYALLIGTPERGARGEVGVVAFAGGVATPRHELDAPAVGHGPGIRGTPAPAQLSG